MPSSSRKQRSSSTGSADSLSSSSGKKKVDVASKVTKKSSKKAIPEVVETDEVSDAEEEEEEEDAEEEEKQEVSKSKGRNLRNNNNSQESLSFFKLGSRMLKEGKVSSKYLKADSSSNTSVDSGKSSSSGVLKSTWQRPSNAIERAAQSSNLYDGKTNTASQLREAAKSERSKKTLGKGWFNQSPAEMSSELSNDMKVVQMRNYLDPKRFYKNPDKLKNVIGVGTVIEGPDEFTTQRLSKKDRKQTLVGEILADRSIKDYTKRKYAEIQNDKEKASKKKKKLGQRPGIGSGSRKIRKLY
jgi:hypothetical protein